MLLRRPWRVSWLWLLIIECAARLLDAFLVIIVLEAGRSGGRLHTRENMRLLLRLNSLRDELRL